jgi:hypothetical protein
MKYHIKPQFFRNDFYIHYKEKDETQKRSDFLPKFSEWLKENGADSENVNIRLFACS